MSTTMSTTMIGQMGGRKLIDSYGRVADDLRISVTDRCNFRCIYCMPAEGLKWLPRGDNPRVEEIVRPPRVFLERHRVRPPRRTGRGPPARAERPQILRP